MNKKHKHTHKILTGMALTAAALSPSSLSALDRDEVNTVVDVAFMWTQERQNNYGGKSQTLANMRQSLGITNRANDNSKTGVLFNYIARSGYVPYNASSSNNNIVRDLRDGRVTGAYGFRDTTGADVMALNGQMSAAGLAFLGDPRQYAVKYLTGSASAHELGHTFGCGHGGIGAGFEDGRGDTGYAAGWAFRDSSNRRFGTVMTGAQILWYSTPERTFQGRRTGIAGTKDSTRRIRETRRESSRIRRVRPEGGRSGGWWTVTNRYSNHNMALASNNSNNGTRLVQRARQANVWEQWRFDDARQGGGWITSRNRGSGKAIDMTGNANRGRFIHQWSYNINNRNQHFKFDTDDSGLLRLRFRVGGNVIHNHGRRGNSGNKLTQWNWQGGSHLQWYLQRLN